MIEFSFAKVCVYLQVLMHHLATLDNDIANGFSSNLLPMSQREPIANNVEGLITTLRGFGIPRALAEGSVLVQKLRDNTMPWNVFALREQLEALNRAILQETQQHKWLRLDHKYVDYITSHQPWGSAVHATFESASFDIICARYAIAVDLPTASVFHSMRVAEDGLKWIARQLNVELTDKGQPIPIDEAVWNKIIEGIDGKIRIARQSVGTEKRAQLEMYANAAQQCGYMKDIWRNNISHRHRTYSALEAEGAMQRVRDFMLSLVAITSYEVEIDQ
jgi:hypothetical protein